MIGESGIMLLNDTTVFVRPLTIRREYDNPAVIECEILADFSKSTSVEQFEAFKDINRFNERIIKKVIFNAPATIVYWWDGTKTVVKCQPGDVYSEELGLAMAISKKYLGNKGNFNDEFKKWIPEKTEATDIHNVSISEKKARLDQYCEFNICPRCELNESGCPGTESDKGFYDLSDAEICRLYDKVFRQKN